MLYSWNEVSIDFEIPAAYVATGSTRSKMLILTFLLSNGSGSNVMTKKASFSATEESVDPSVNKL